MRTRHFEIGALWVALASLAFACNLSALVGAPATQTPVVVVVTATPALPTQTPVVVVVTAAPAPATQTPFVVVVEPTPAPAAPTAPTTMSAPMPTPKPTPNFVLTFSDSFDDPESGPGNTGDAEYYREQGEFIIQASVYHARKLQPRVADFLYAADTRFLEGADSAGVGLSFRGDARNYYAFYINRRGEYCIGKFMDSKWQALGTGLCWAASPYVKAGAASNHLSVVAHGDTISFLVNGKQ